MCRYCGLEAYFDISSCCFCWTCVVGSNEVKLVNLANRGRIPASCQTWFAPHVKASKRTQCCVETPLHIYRRAYRWGMLGPFQRYTGLNVVDGFQRVKNVWGKAFLGRLVWPYKKLRVKKYDYPGF